MLLLLLAVAVANQAALQRSPCRTHGLAAAKAALAARRDGQQGLWEVLHLPVETPAARRRDGASVVHRPLAAARTAAPSRRRALWRQHDGPKSQDARPSPENAGKKRDVRKCGRKDAVWCVSL